MRLDNVFCKRFVVAWTHSTTVRQVARRLGECLTAEEVWRVARRLRRAGVDLTPLPDGLGILGHTYLFRHPDGDFRDLRSREAYRVGVGTPIEGPWECCRCGDGMVGGYCVLPRSGGRQWFVCRECTRVID